jgi:chromosomal replication initiator protein
MDIKGQKTLELRKKKEFHLEEVRKINFLLGDSNKYYSGNDFIISDIKNVVCEFFEVSLCDLEGTSRKRTIREPRQIAIYLIMNRTKKVSLRAAGGEFGKDHTTAIHCLKVINNFIDTEPEFKLKIDELNLRLDQKAIITTD